MTAELREQIEIVTLHCPKCPRKFRTMAWIARTKAPSCPLCNVKMECSEVQDVSVLASALEHKVA